VSESSNHLSAFSLEQYLEGTLPSAESAEARTHLESCGRCSAELDSCRNLFVLLGNLPRYAPSPLFADAVMARVQLTPQEGPVAAWIRRLIPTTRRGWLVLGTMVTAPATPIVALITLMLVQPLVTPAALLQWGSLRAESLAQASFSWLTSQTLGIGAWDRVAPIVASLQNIPASALAGALALISVAIPLSAWGLVKLTRTPGARVTYAS